MDNLDDAVPNSNNGEAVRVDEEVSEIHEEIEIKFCCRCDQMIDLSQEVFDTDNCAHHVCFGCRFREDLNCSICHPLRPKVTTSLNEKTPNYYVNDYVVCMKRKKITTDHIVNVERSDSNKKHFLKYFEPENLLWEDNFVRPRFRCVAGRKKIKDICSKGRKCYCVTQSYLHYRLIHIMVMNTYWFCVSTADGGVQRQMCTVCRRVFKSTNARYHYMCVTGDKPFICVECGQKFVKKSHMEMHLNNHFGIKPFKCTVEKCTSSFTQKDKLVRHMKGHNNSEKYICSICDKAYASQDILHVHIGKVHSSAKPFQCDLCPRSYKYKKSLRVHRLKHKALKEYMCEICGKKYSVFAQLKHHKRSHIMYHKRAHKCGCGRRFMTAQDKARHQLTHNSAKDFECSLCNTTFGRKDNLERHMKNFHEISLPKSGKTPKLTAIVSPFNKTKKMTGTKKNEQNASNKSDAAHHIINKENGDEMAKLKEESKSVSLNEKLNKTANKELYPEEKHFEELDKPMPTVIVSPKLLISKQGNTCRGTDNVEPKTNNFNENMHPKSKKIDELTGYKTKKLAGNKKNKQNPFKSNIVQKVVKDENYKIDQLKVSKKSKSVSPNKKLSKTANNTEQKDIIIVEKQMQESDEPMATVIVSLKPTEDQQRPSVIKAIPNLLPYRVLSPDKRLTDETHYGKSPSDLMPPPGLNKIYDKPKPKRTTTHKLKVLQDAASNRCFRIIRHTSSVQQPVNKIQRSDTLVHDMNDLINGPIKITPEEKSNENMKTSVPNVFLTNNTPEQGMCQLSDDKLPFTSALTDSCNVSSKYLGGPTLPTSLQEVIEASDTTNPEVDSFSYTPLGESSCTTYTPYFDSDCFRDGVNNYEDLYMGFQ